MKEKILEKNSLKWIWGLLSAATLLFACLTLHDMQTSEGVGLYLAMRAGREAHGLFDILVDGAGLLCLFGAVILPCIVSGYRRPDSFWRLLSAYLAFLPTISLASLVHLLDGTKEIQLCEAFASGRWEEALREGLGGVIFLLAAGGPALILAAGLRKEESSGEGGGAPAGRGKLWNRQTAAGIFCVVLLLAAVFFPALTEQCSYFFHYLILICGFWVWEKLYEKEQRLKTWGMVLFGIFWFRGIYRMIEVMSLY